MREYKIKRSFLVFAICLILLSAVSIGAQLQKPKKPEKDKRYLSMTDIEKREFVKTEADKLLEKFGRIKGDEIPEIGLIKIKAFVEQYARRAKPIKERVGNCRFGDDLKTMLLRGKKYSYAISQSFKEKLLNPEIGIYLAMIESEFCPCIQAPTGALGMFQLASSSGKAYGLQTYQLASPDNPDERCAPVKASKATAGFFDELLRKKRINGNYGRDANGILLAIAAYNSGETGLKRNIKATEAILGESLVTFWSLMKNSALMLRQFQRENVNYVPKFLAAAIVGENLEVFGVARVSALSS